MNIGDNFIDSRELIGRLAELEGEIADWIEDYMLEKGVTELSDDDFPEDVDLVAMREEADLLRGVQEQADHHPGWEDGVLLILDEYFVEYAKDCAAGIHGTEITDGNWPFDHINWEEAADALKQDYFYVTAEEYTYWIRS